MILTTVFGIYRKLVLSQNLIEKNIKRSSYHSIWGIWKYFSVIFAFLRSIFSNFFLPSEHFLLLWISSRTSFPSSPLSLRSHQSSPCFLSCCLPNFSVVATVAGMIREAFKSKKVQNFGFWPNRGGGGVWTRPLKTKPIFWNVQMMVHLRQSRYVFELTVTAEVGANLFNSALTVYWTNA